jgi:competence protein ComEA
MEFIILEGKKMLEDRKVKVFLITLAIALTAGLGIKAFVGFKPPPAAVEPVVAPVQDKAQEMVIYVTGAVVKQGLVKLPIGSRLADALLAAGQAEDADLSTLNLAEKLKDGQKVVVPRQGTPSPGNGQALPPGASPTAPSSIAKAAGSKVNINTASAQELDTLPGIGPAMSERIINYRTEKGSFTKTEELKDVPGIGDKKYAELLPLITVD